MALMTIRLLWAWDNPTERRMNWRLMYLQALGQEARHRMQVATWEEPGDSEDPRLVPGLESGECTRNGKRGRHCCV